jgi:Na+/H+ antiporter NhaD/arsenite permease-like protein
LFPVQKGSSGPGIEYSSTKLAIVILCIVFLLIAVRQVGRFNLKIWQVMLGGAVAVLALGQIGADDALRAINTDVMIFLFGMFIVGEALVMSGWLQTAAHRIFSRATTPDHLILLVLFGGGILSAILMNDTIAIIGTPLVLALAAQNRLPPKLLLLALAFAITTGSVASPIGNPQNLLVAVETGMLSPFVTFGIYLILPTLACLVVTWLVLRTAFSRDFRHYAPQPAAGTLPCDTRLAFLAQCSLAIIVILAAAKIVASITSIAVPLTLPLIAVIAAAPVIIFSEKRFIVIRQIDWPTLVFFAAMFVLMAAVWQTQFFQSFIGTGDLLSVPAILILSVSTSQFISNVPFVALFLPLIQQAGGTTAQFMALAAGSTIAGNLTILGAASNVIIIQNAEREGETVSFFEFARIGVLITILQIAIYWAWLTVVL